MHVNVESPILDHSPRIFKENENHDFMVPKKKFDRSAYLADFYDLDDGNVNDFEPMNDSFDDNSTLKFITERSSADIELREEQFEELFYDYSTRNTIRNFIINASIILLIVLFGFTLGVYFALALT